MHLLIDNYDSFTYNIVHALEAKGCEIAVFRNDKIDLEKAKNLDPSAIIISPGPGHPKDSGICIELIRHFAGIVPILGVCLGHQCIVEAFGGVVTRAGKVMHGKASPVYHDGKTIYDGLSNPFLAGRYHSLLVKEDALPNELEISAYTSEGEVMGVRVKGAFVEGVQFHPESILTCEGDLLLTNFVRLIRERKAEAADY